MNRCFRALLLLMLLATGPLAAQNTVGLISYDPLHAFDGYNLLYPHNQPHVYLLDNCGEIVHVWEDEANWRPGNTAYLLPDGRLVKTKRQAAVTNDAIWAGGGGAVVEIRDWENNLLWSFERNNEQERLHHDIAITQDETILMVVWEVKSSEEAIQAGRNPDLLTEGELWPDYILEVDPATDEVVWEWHVWDHLIQDFDATKDNFGVVADHPELVDINWDTSDGEADWMHGNAIDFHPINDQVILSVPTFNEVWIIDHTTSTEQAASHSGGFSGRGGDLMYRWGNPATYGAGTSEDQQLFYQHDIHWIDDFLNASFPYFGRLAVFNNRVGEDFSTVNVFSPNYDMYNWDYPMEDGVWGPSEFDLTITHPEPSRLFSSGLSSVQFLPNGNALITDGRHGYTFELSPENEIVWEYVTPLMGGQPATQGDVLDINNNLTFRVKRYPTDYDAFTDRDLTPTGWLELEPDMTFCNLILPAREPMDDYHLKIYPNPVADRLTVEWEGNLYVTIQVVDVLGRTIYYERQTGGRAFLSTEHWEPGLYTILINGISQQKLMVVR